MVDETQTRLAQRVIWLAREGVPVPQDAITWALQISGDLEGSGYATPELWDFLRGLQNGL